MKRTSKYLGKTFNGWTVFAMEKTEDGNHNRFFLVTRRDNKSLTMTLRDNELTKLSRQLKTVGDLEAGKAYERHIDCNVFRNMVERVKYN